MTATSSPAKSGISDLPVAPPSGFRPLVMDVMRSEWTKLRTVRSTYWTLLVTGVGMIAFSAVLTVAYVNHYNPAARGAFDPAAYSLSGFFLAQLAIGVLGAVVITSEYGTGSIRATLAATPRRYTVLIAKAAVFGGVAAIVGIASSLVSFFIGQAILSKKGLEVHLGDPGTVRSVIGAGLYLAILGLLALGIGALVRRTAGAIATFVGLVLILPVFVEGLPSSWQSNVTKYLPSVAGQATIGRTKFTPSGHLLGPWAGFGVLCAYTLAVLLAAAIVLNHRDA